MPSEHPDLILNDGVEIRWVYKDDQKVGGLISHPFPENNSGRCWGSFCIKGLGWDNHPEWSMAGTFECPTLEPSFLCHCGFHGYIREGKWVPA